MAAIAVTAAVLGVGVLPLGTSVPAAAASLNQEQVAGIQKQFADALKNINPTLKGQDRVRAITLAIQAITTDLVAKFGSGALASVAAAASRVVQPTVAVPAVLAAAVSVGVDVPTAVAQITAGNVANGTSATEVTQTVIAAGAQQNLSTSQVGAGLGAAAAQVAQANPAAAVQISSTIANEAPSSMTQSYATSVIASGGSTQLADKSVQPPSAIVGGTANNGGNAVTPAGQPGTTAGATTSGGTGSTQSVTGNPSVGTSNSALPPCHNPSCT